MKSFIRIAILVFLMIPFSCNKDIPLSYNSGISEASIVPTYNMEEQLDAEQQIKANKIDSFFQQKFRANVFNGVVLVAEKGKVVHKKAYGYKDLRKKDSLSINTPFQLASVSKPITAIATLILYEEGRLKLQDNVKQYIPQFPYEGITLKMLLTHRSGLPNYMYFADKYWDVQEDGPISNEDVLCLMEKHEPNKYYIPDYRYNYCNTNYMLLASIIERVTGMEYADFMNARIFKPLGMENTSIYNKCKEPKGISDGAVGYLTSRRKAGNSYLNGVVGDKGIYSTVENLYKLDRALHHGFLLTRKTLEKAYQPHHSDLHDHDNYGLGWRINSSQPENKIVWHNGWWKGFRTYFIRMLDKDKTIIILNNTTNGSFLNNQNLIDLVNEPIEQSV